MPVSSAAVGTLDERRKVASGDIAVGVVIGRASEYFDFFVYGIASVLVFPQVFFPFVDKLHGILYAFTVFPLAFIARPIGTIASMWVQRRWGRGTKLTAAMFLIGTCTAGIAFLPGYETLGSTAIVLLALFRFGQGLALGGSWDGLPSLLAMNAPKGRRSWYSMLGQLGAPIGFIVAASLFAYIHSQVNADDFTDWGWRFPFYCAFAINVVALFARLSLVLNEEYEEELGRNDLQPVSVANLVRAKGRYLLIGAFTALASYALFHIVTIFPISWILLYTDQEIGEFLWLQVFGAFLAMGAVVVSGLIADQLGRTKTLAGLALAIAAYSGFAPQLLAAGQRGQDVFVLLGFILLGLSYGQAAGATNANFGSTYRYTGAALTSDLAWLIGAAFAPLVALSLVSHLGLTYVGLYLLSGAAGTLIALGVNRYLREKKKTTNGNGTAV